MKRFFLRPGWRALSLAALVPALVLGAFGETSFVAHAHHGHGVHWHAAPSPVKAEFVALIWNADPLLARLRAGVTRAMVENAGLWPDPPAAADLARIIESVEHP